MTNFSSSSLPETQKNKRVRFNEETRASEIDEVSNEKQDEDYECILTVGEADNGASSVRMRSVLSRDAEVSSEEEGSRSPTDLFSFPYAQPQARTAPKDHPTNVTPRNLRLPIGLFSESPYTGSTRCMDIISSALDCIESVDSYEISA